MINITLQDGTTWILCMSNKAALLLEEYVRSKREKNRKRSKQKSLRGCSFHLWFAIKMQVAAKLISQVHTLWVLLSQKWLAHTWLSTNPPPCRRSNTKTEMVHLRLPHQIDKFIAYHFIFSLSLPLLFPISFPITRRIGIHVMGT